jgi:general secretion pathway protein J
MSLRSAIIGRHTGGEAGFTLVELLVGLALFSLLVTLLFDNVRFGLRAWHSAGTSAEQFERSMISQDLLRRTIGNLYPMMVVTNGALQQQIDFEGTREVISFLGNAPIASNGGGRFRFSIFVERKQEQAELVMTSTPELASSDDQSMTRRTLLLSGIDRAEFSYLGETAMERKLQWNDSWAKRSDIPRLVRLRVGFRSGDARLWPDLLIAPRILADVSCVYDPITTRCRGR